jgi:hypothetical protein
VRAAPAPVQPARSLLALLVMLNRTRALLVAVAIGNTMCSPYLPPTTVPESPVPSTEADAFRAALQAYVDQTQPYRKQAAQAGNRVPGQTGGAANAEIGLRTRQNTLADALKTTLRPQAHQGDLIVAPAAAAIRRQMADAFAGPKRDLLMDALAEQNDAGAKAAPQIVINQHVDAPRVPPLLLETLPPLPKQLEYDFIGRTLLLRDIDADAVVDFLPDALPAQPPAGVPTVPPQPVSSTTPAPLPMPGGRGTIVFALVGDSGSGDIAQQTVAQAMLSYFTSAHHFPFVLMLGDNLYDDDYTGEFTKPYTPLLDRGVKFYAAIGNHDRDLEIHFKPFNMQDRDSYTFDQGNARFVALNSNHPADPAQIKWLDTVFADAGNKWRICFFHHPLYSSGLHASESRDVIRPALEPALVRNHVDVVFSGHDHLYERVKPQQGIRYFVSGGGGRSLYDFNRSSFDEVGISEHHFMVVQLGGDRLLYEAITPAQKLLDCGILFRTPDSASKSLDNDTKAWVAACEAGRPVISTRRVNK